MGGGRLTGAALVNLFKYKHACDHFLFRTLTVIACSKTKQHYMY